MLCRVNLLVFTEKITRINKKKWSGIRFCSIVLKQTESKNQYKLMSRIRRVVNFTVLCVQQILYCP